MRTAAPLALLLAFLLPAPLRAQDTMNDMGSVVWHMRGTLVATEQAANDVGYDAVTFGFTGKADTKTRWFGVVYADIFGGDTFDAHSYVDRVSHYNPTFTVAGQPAQAAQLLAMPDGTRVALEGVLETNSRVLLLDSVKQLPASSGQ